MPTEAQWEYACRAGTMTPFNFGEMLNGDKANCNGQYPYGTDTQGQYVDKPVEVGLYPANAWGLYDMHGNIWEWCSDWYGNYPTGSVVDPVGPPMGVGRVLRGGCWNSGSSVCRAAFRLANSPMIKRNTMGLRLSLVQHMDWYCPTEKPKPEA